MLVACIIVLIVGIIVIMQFGELQSDYVWQVNTETTIDNIANYKQRNAKTSLYADAGNLYFSQRRLDRYNDLYWFADHEIVSIMEGDQRELLMVKDNKVYYKQLTKQETFDLLCMDLTTKEKSLLYENVGYAEQIFMGTNNTLYIRINEEEDIYISGDGGEVEYIKEGYTLGNKTYWVEASKRYMNTDVVCLDNNTKDSYLLDLPYGDKTLIPCEKGLIIHNAGQGDLLYLITGNGNIQKLFSTVCMSSKSAVNVYEDYIYFSLIRYESWAESGKGMQTFADDNISGTYRIDINTFTTEMISDRAYCGLFIFDNTGMFATDEWGNIVKMDFFGNILQDLSLAW